MCRSQASRPASSFLGLVKRRVLRFPLELAAPNGRRECRLLSFVVLLAAASLGQAAQKPFLPAVGPVPLRFADDAPAGLARYPMPPLDMGWPTNASVEIAAQPSNPTTPTSETNQASTEPMLDLGQNPFADLPAPTPPTRRAPVNETVTYLSPEADLVQPLTTEPDSIYPPELLRMLRNNTGNTITGYFNAQRPTNGAVVIAPLGFEPPQPAATPSSSATYNVVPADSK